MTKVHADVYSEVMEDLGNAIRKNIDDIIVWDIMKTHHKDWTEVKIPWEIQQGKTPWNEVCAWALEEFGLPGDRYVTHPDADEMTFLFRDSEDAVLMILRWT